LLTNAIANAGIRGRRNVWILYLHLCWHEKAERFNPALAIASTVSAKFRIHGNLQNINSLRLFRSLKIHSDRQEFLAGQL
jgi:hypothetical protein